MSANIAGWCGVIAGVLGLVASFLLARPAFRTGRIDEARVALRLFKQGRVSQSEQQQEHDPLAAVSNDLDSELAATFLKNRSDMKWGAIVLMLAFAFVVAQSLILVNAA